MNILDFEKLDSTNSYVAANATSLPSMTMVCTREQTAGRGQRGNTWESTPGENLTLSLLHRPAGVPARCQFAISEAVALAVADTLADYNIEANVKWPNDIYIGDSKICGILIEHSLFGSEIQHTISGIGLNVNQRQFLSDAPNPVSMWQLSGEEYDLTEVRARLAIHLETRIGSTESADGRDSLHSEYKRRLWRREGFHPYRDTATGAIFSATIADIEPQGFLLLLPEAIPDQPDRPLLRYAFKEVAFL